MTMEDPAAGPARLRQLAYASVAEGTTLLLLLGVAVPLKHLGGWPLAVQVMGPVHGFAFLLYLWIAVQTASAAGWPRADLVRLLVAAVVPFGGYLNVQFLARKAAEARGGAGR